MKDGICPKCHSNEILTGLRVMDSQVQPTFVEIKEPEPPNRPFILRPQNVRSQFQASVCGGCGYTEFYAVNYQMLNEGRRKGFQSS